MNETEEDFIFLSPIPYPISTKYSGNMGIIGPMTPAECVEFYWRTKRVTISTSLSLFMQTAGYEEPTWDCRDSEIVYSTGSDCAFGVPMKERILKTTPCLMEQGECKFQISGPYLAQDYPLETGFENRMYVYAYSFNFAVGCIKITENYIKTDHLDNPIITVEQYPFSVFGKTYYLYLSMPEYIKYPEKYIAEPTESHYSGSASINFEFL